MNKLSSLPLPTGLAWPGFREKVGNILGVCWYGLRFGGHKPLRESANDLFILTHAFDQ